jgi:hypothetical protein
LYRDNWTEINLCVGIGEMDIFGVYLRWENKKDEGKGIVRSGFIHGLYQAF